MLKLWGKLIKDNKTIKHITIDLKNDSTINFEEISMALYSICLELDLSVPIWLNDNYKDLKSFNKTKFNHGHFIEEISFDSLEIEIIWLT